MDYEPLDLSPYTNAGLDVYARTSEAKTSRYNLQRDPPVGAQTFHGLPFQIGPVESPEGLYFIALGPDWSENAVRVPVGKTARYVIFAHALLDTRLWEGGPLGEVVARYVFHYEDGRRVEAPVRERFEVSPYPFAHGQKPFLCLSDSKNERRDRYRGPWEAAGWRHTEVRWGQPQGYFLFPWRNPHPEQPLAALELIAGDYTFVLAAVTLCHLEEFPFTRQTRRPVKITLPEAEDAAPPFALEIDVDRGVATWPFALPVQSLKRAAPERRGFGAPFNPANSPAYTQVAAIPSATLTLRKGEEVLGRVNWEELNRQGAVETPRARLEVLGDEKNWVRVEVRDEENGELLPCRVAFHSPAGVPYPPHGHHAPVFANLDTWNNDVGGDLRLGQVSYAYIDGRCQGWLPRGRALVEAACGFEYEPVREWVEIAPGQQRLTIRLKRMAHMNEAGWYSGDSHVHFLTARGSLLEARGEGLNVVNLLQSQWGHYFSNVEEFTGRPHTSPDGRTVVYVSQENRQHMFGHLSLLGLKEPVMPWCSGGPSEAELGGGLDVTLTDWADACHAQGGTVVVPHLGVTNGEQAALIATGRADAVEMLTDHDYYHQEYYRYLNGGYRLPLAGGTDKMDSQVPVGLYRTYVYLGDEPFSFESWCAGLRAGRTFLSGGPLLEFTVEGQPVGSTLRVPGGGTVEVQARARSIFPIHTLQIVERGRVVAETGAEEGRRELSLRAQLKVADDTWLAARCGGPGYVALPHLDSWGRGVMAHTSPVYVAGGESYDLFDANTVQYMLTLMDGNLKYIRELSPLHDPGRTTFPHGEADHQAHLERPFHQAREALHRRLHARGIPH